MFNRKLLIVIMTAIFVLSSCSFGEGILPKSLGQQTENDIVKAVQSGNLESVKEELAKGADVNTTFVATNLGTIPRRVSLYAYAAMESDLASRQIASLLFENGADVNFLYPTGGFPLMNAAGSNDVAECQALLQHGADINMHSKDGTTALDEAAQWGACDTLCFLMENGLEPTHETLQLAMDEEQYEAAHILAAHLTENGDQTKLSAVMQAAVLGDTQAVVQYCKDGALTEKNRDIVGCYAAAFCGREALAACLAHGFPLEKEGRDSPLILAVQCGNLDTADYLLKQYPEETKRELNDALKTAVWHDQVRAVQYLLNTGYRFTLSDTFILADAANLGNLPILKLLLDSGQEISHETLEQAVTNSLIQKQEEPIKLLLPLETWTEDELTSFLMLSHTQELWELCLACGLNPSDDTWAYPLISAAERGNLQAVNYLLSKGADPSYANAEIGSALIEAIRYGFYDIAEFLIEHGADVNQFNGSCAALHYAAMYSTNLTRLLLENGADVNVQTQYGDTPLMYAIKYGKASTVSLLLQAGADTSIQNEDGETAQDLAEASWDEALKACFA